MLLSIVMMVKNEGQILEKTLKSLEKLRKEMKSELIILDTGSTDNTVDIAKKYTDKVYFEKWNDDFSSMRNKSISYAKGEWLLVIDADEVLTNYDKLLKFFSDGLDKKYNSASIKLRNIYSYDEKSFGETSIVRFFKRENFRYEGIVHEQPIFRGPIYNDLLNFNHYGYLFEDEELREKKVKRNEKLLLIQLNDNPKDPYANYQMGKNLIGEDKCIEALEYLEKSLRYYRNMGIDPEYLYSSLAKVYCKLGRSEKCIKLCNKYIKKDRNNIDIYYFLGTAQAIKGRFEQSIASYNRYLYLINNYEITTQANSIYSDTETLAVKDSVLVTIIKMLMNLEKYSIVQEYFDKIEQNDQKKEAYKYLFKALIEEKRYEEILQYYNKLDNLDIERQEFYNSIENLIEDLKESKKNIIYSLFSNLDNNYGELNKIRLENCINKEQCIKILREEKQIIYGKLLNIAVDNKIRLLDILSCIDNIWIEKYLIIAIAKERKILKVLYEEIMEVGNTFDIENIRIYKTITKTLLGYNFLDDRKYIELFYINNMYTYQYIKMIYKEFDDDNILKLLSNDNYRFSIKFRNLIQNNDTKQKQVEIIKELIIEYPHYKKVLGRLIDKLINDISQSEELEVLKTKFIKNITKMVSEENLEDANNMINDYIELFDYSAEILNIKGVIEYIKGNAQYADRLFKKALSLDLYNEDIIYNIESLNI